MNQYEAIAIFIAQSQAVQESRLAKGADQLLTVTESLPLDIWLEMLRIYDYRLDHGAEYDAAVAA